MVYDVLTFKVSLQATNRKTPTNMVYDVVIIGSVFCSMSRYLRLHRRHGEYESNSVLDMSLIDGNSTNICGLINVLFKKL